jgi:hypothetical protein
MISCISTYFGSNHNVNVLFIQSILKKFIRCCKSEKQSKEKLTTSGFYYIPLNGLGLAGITADTSAGLMLLQAKIIDALKPYFVKGTNAAFIQNADGTPIASSSADYVNRFVPDHSRGKYLPHITIGLAQESFLKELLAKPYKKLTFKSPSVSIYHLGDFGTAQKRLWTSEKNDLLK